MRNTPSARNLTATECAFLTPEFLTTLPRVEHFSTRSEAFAFRIYIYRLLSAARNDGTPQQMFAATCIGQSQPREQPDGTWTLTLFNKMAVATAQTTPAGRSNSRLASMVAELATPTTQADHNTPPRAAPQHPMSDALARLGYGNKDKPD